MAVTKKVVVIVRHQDNVLVISPRASAPQTLPDGTEIWLLPGGHVEEGEGTDEAAVREVWEEAGIAIYEDYDSGPIGMHVKTSVPHFAAVYRVAARAIPVLGVKDPEDGRRIKWVPSGALKSTLTFPEHRYFATMGEED